MPDIALRFNKDMLVLSTPLDYQLKAQGFDLLSDREYVALCEPELVEEAFRLEKIIETPCLVTATEGITNARLSHSNFEDRAPEMAEIAYKGAASFTPQHIIAAIGPTGLPLDPSSAASLKQSRFQYEDAVRALSSQPFDALYFTGFASAYDAQCALMGARAVYDGPLMVSLLLDEDQQLASGHTLEEAVALCDDSGADVIGIVSSVGPEALEALAARMVSATDKPLLVDIAVGPKNPRQFAPTEEEPYPSADALVDAAWRLRNAGVQFLRASGHATPAYTGALLATVMGHDVVNP